MTLDRLPAGHTCRHAVRASDAAAIATLVGATGFFSAEEQAIAVELVDERLAKGPASGYEFLLIERAGAPVAYACYGPILGTASSWDLYWIVVAPGSQRTGLGRWLVAEVERDIARRGGRRIYVDTSSRAQYDPTRRFYAVAGYRTAALFEDFYAEGDGKVILLKVLA